MIDRYKDIEELRKQMPEGVELKQGIDLIDLIDFYFWVRGEISPIEIEKIDRLLKEYEERGFD